MAREREYQTILQQVLKEREQEITLLRMRSESAGLSLNSLGELKIKKKHGRKKQLNNI